LFYQQDEEGKADEVEDLYNLLKEAKEEYKIEAVSSGAILSDYQRLRVENVCSRLGLFSLSYIWESDQVELLDKMIENELDARLVKIACIGLQPSFLMKSIKELRDQLHELKEKYQINVCGEGGEYESIVLDCPLFINHKIKVEDYKVVIVSNDECAPVANVIFTKFGLEPKEQPAPIEFLNPEEELIKIHSQDEESKDSLEDLNSEITEINFENDESEEKLLIDGNEFHTIPMTLSHFGITPCESIENEVLDLLTNLQSLLELSHLTFKNVSKVFLVIRNMADFAKINEVYNAFFIFRPPTRVCVSLPFTTEFNVSIQMFGWREIDKIEHLHVQSISSWAPANVGPCSQACKNESKMQFSGVIGLVPESLKIVDPDPILQLKQIFRNMGRVFKRMGVSFESSLECQTFI
jgi:diphthine-ammonia ligase